MTTPTLAAPKRKEKDIQREILKLLHARGVVAWKAGSGGFRVQEPGKRERYVKMGHTGVADIIGVASVYIRCERMFDRTGDRTDLCWGKCQRWGRFLAIEVKVPGNDATPEQAVFLASVRQAGGLAFVAHSCEDVAKELGWT